MADLERHEADALIQALQGKKCCGHDFFRVVRAVQALRQDLPPIGTSKSPDDDPIRFGQRPSLSFPASTLDELVAGEIPRLYVNFFGMLGPNGPLPLHLTQYALSRELGQTPDESRLATGGMAVGNKAGSGIKDRSFGDFLDIFHHRLLSFFFRAWASCQPAVDLDRNKHQRFLFFLASFIGESVFDFSHEPVDDDAIPLQAKLFYTGHLASPARNVEGLESVLTGYFGIQTKVTEFIGKWFNLPKEDWSKLGAASSYGRLGEGIIVGSKTWDVHLSFRVRMGPMGFDDYCRLLPRENGFDRLKSWVSDYCGAELSWDLQLVLRGDEVPATQLGRAGKLGWTTWLKTQPFRHDADDLVLQTE